MKMHDEFKTTPDCCDIWPKIRDSFAWFQFDDYRNVYAMPCIEDVECKPVWRVNYCPSCGAERRSVVWNTNND